MSKYWVVLQAGLYGLLAPLPADCRWYNIHELHMPEAAEIKSTPAYPCMTYILVAMLEPPVAFLHVTMTMQALAVQCGNCTYCLTVTAVAATVLQDSKWQCVMLESCLIIPCFHCHDHGKLPQPSCMPSQVPLKCGDAAVPECCSRNSHSATGQQVAMCYAGIMPFNTLLPLP